MILSVHQPQYIPWLGYFDKIDKSDCFIFLNEVQYKQREYQNRNKVRTKDGWMWLTVPIKSKGMRQQKINSVRINNDYNWQKQHCQSLRSWYGRAQFFKDHFPFFEKIYNEKWEKLKDLNVEHFSLRKHIIRTYNPLVLQIRRLEKEFLEQGGLRERMTRARIAARSRRPPS